jgi:hypothetical protein
MSKLSKAGQRHTTQLWRERPRADLAGFPAARGHGGAAVGGSDTRGDGLFRLGRIRGGQADARAGHSRGSGAGERKVLTAALGHWLSLLIIGSVCGMILGVLATKPLPYIVPDAFVSTSR